MRIDRDMVHSHRIQRISSFFHAHSVTDMYVIIFVDTEGSHTLTFHFFQSEYNGHYSSSCGMKKVIYYVHAVGHEKESV